MSLQCIAYLKALVELLWASRQEFNQQLLLAVCLHVASMWDHDGHPRQRPVAGRRVHVQGPEVEVHLAGVPQGDLSHAYMVIHLLGC